MDWRATAFAAALGLSFALAQAAETPARPAPPTLAVLNFTNRHPADGWDWLSKGLADMLITDLSATPRLRLVTREDMQSLFDEMELGRTGVLEPTTERKFGKLIRADRVLTGSFWVEGRRMTLEAHIIDVAGAVPLRFESVTGEAAEVLQLEKQLALEIVKRLDLPLTEAERQALLRLPTLKVEAAAELYRGIDFADTGRPYEALASFRTASQADARYDEARVWEGQAYAGLGESAHAAAAFKRLLADHPDTPLRADALYWLGALNLGTLDRPAEAVACFRRLQQGPFRLRTLRPFSYADLGTLPPEAAPALLLARALTRTADYPAAARIYADLYKPFITARVSHQDLGAVDAFGEYHPSGPGSEMLRRETDRFLARVIEATGQAPILPSGMLALDPRRPVYEEDYSTNKRFSDGRGILSSAMPPDGVDPDVYLIAMKGPHAIRSLTVTVTSGAGATVLAQGQFEEAATAAEAARRYQRSVSLTDGTREHTFAFDPAAPLVTFRIAGNRGLLQSWRIAVECGPLPRATDPAPETMAGPAPAGVDGPGWGVTEAVRLDARRDDGLPKLGPDLRRQAGGNILQADILFYPDGAARLFLAREGDLWTACALRPGDWSALERLPLPVNTLARTDTPRAVLLEDRTVLLAWGVPQPDRYTIYVSRCADGRSWSFPRRVATTTAIPAALDLFQTPTGRTFLIGSIYREYSYDEGVFLQEVGPEGARGRKQMLVSSGDYPDMVRSIPAPLFDAAGRCLLFLGDRYIASRDMARWDDPVRFTREGADGIRADAGWAERDGRVILAGSRSGQLAASRDTIRWEPLGSLGARPLLRVRTQANGLPALLWMQDGEWRLCRAIHTHWGCSRERPPR